MDKIVLLGVMRKNLRFSFFTQKSKQMLLHFWKWKEKVEI